ncbi:serine/threonine protein kinase [Nocardia sp. NPDC059240]|uniref:serine/threonine protein kinase n=1 Tax=Nocardia sp. NPDC059240 TaxID=3346786 RepID=UPI0036B97FEE
MTQPLGPDDPVMIGGYRTLAKLGAGGMGRVLLGAGPDGRLVAIKQIHAHLLDGYEYRARFRQEISASTRVSGAFTAPVIDFDVDAAQPWLASAFMLGVPLDRVIAEHAPLPVPAVRALAVGLAVALHDIHAAGLVHRDLKPANVILAADGPRVIDFGIAKLNDASGLTETGAALGSPAYMSPEQALAEPITPASDIFALGSLLVTAATGAAPFAAPSMAYTLFNIAHSEPDLSRVPEQLRGWIAACLHKDPRQRPTPGQLLDHLGRLPGGDAPWPAPVHESIRAQAGQLSGIVASPYATQVISRSGRHAGLATGTARPGTVAALRARRGRRLGLVAGLAVLVLTLVAAGIAVLVKPEPAAGQHLPEPGLAQLRAADPCAWARQSLPASVPDGSGFAADTSSWTWAQGDEFGCEVKSGDASLWIKVGESINLASTATGATADGFPILADTGAAYGDVCYRGVDLSGSGGKWGIQFQVHPSTSCVLAQQILSGMITTRHRIPVHPDRATLAEVDPCALIPREQLDPLIGPLPQQPTTVTAHTCVWDGTDSVRTDFELLGKSGGSSSPVDLGDGVQALIDDSDDGVCYLDYVYRTVGDNREVLNLIVDGLQSGDKTKVCATAETIMKTEIGRLPKPK